MSAPLAGKVALITGASKGIGRATALELASLGAKVIVNYNTDNSSANALVEQLGADNALAVQADAGKVTEVERLVKAGVDKFGKIDILVPNAGVMPMRDLEQTTEQDFDECFGTNVKGVYFLCQKAVPHMTPGSHIVLISTSLTAISNVTPNYLLYVSTKGAIEQMTRVLAKDLGRKGIVVNAIAPGPTATDLFLKGKPEQLVKTIASANPFNRLGTPEDIAKAIAFMAGGGSDWVNGQVLRVNGGMA